MQGRTFNLGDRRDGVTGLGPDCVLGSWPELTLAALQFRQEPPFPVNKSAHINWLVRFSLSFPSSIDRLSSFGTICLHATRPVTLQSIKKGEGKERNLIS